MAINTFALFWYFVSCYCVSGPRGDEGLQIAEYKGESVCSCVRPYVRPSVYENPKPASKGHQPGGRGRADVRTDG